MRLVSATLIPNCQGLGAELRLLLAEQPGHGRSPGPDHAEAYQAKTVLDQLDQIRSDRGVDRWWLLGQSLGDAMLIRYPIRHPERVAGLVFTNSRAVFGLAGRAASPTNESDSSAKGKGTDRRTKGRAVFSKEPTKALIRALPYHPSNAKRVPTDLQARIVKVADSMPMAVFRHIRTSGLGTRTMIFAHFRCRRCS